MSVLPRNRNSQAPQSAVTPLRTEGTEGTEGEAPATRSSRPAARTRTSAAWLGICLAAVLLVVLIVFLLQNTGSVQVSFLWLDGSLPLAIALLIAGVGAALLTMVVAVARIAQLRRRFRHDH